ncbi:MAG: hypothetical protein WD556_07220 [Actinomycetota bacterium]
MTAATGMVLVLFGTPIALAVILDRPISIDPVRAPAGGTSAYWTGMLAVAALTLLFAHRDPSRRGVIASVRSWFPESADARPEQPLPPVAHASEARITSRSTRVDAPSTSKKRVR